MPRLRCLINREVCQLNDTPPRRSHYFSVAFRVLVNSGQFSISTLMTLMFCVATGLSAFQLILLLNDYEEVRLVWPILGACVGAGVGGFRRQPVRGALIGIGVAFALAVIVPSMYQGRE